MSNNGEGANTESKPLNAVDVAATLRDLVMHLHRGNAVQAESIASEVAQYLQGVMRSGTDPGTFDMRRVQQTMFAIDEVRTLLSQRDFEEAADAARDAGKEWKQQPKSSTGH